MATTSFSESFKYGIRLFGLFVLILLFGGGALAGGAALAIPEILAWSGSGAAETPYIAGGLILAVLGLTILVSGQFAILYKLIADGVSKGNTDPAVDLTVGPAESDEADEQSEQPEPTDAETSEQPAETEPAEQPEPPADSQPAQPSAEAEQPDQPAEQPPAEAEARAEQPAQPAHQQPQEPAGAEGGREQTAEEIVFGSSDGADEQTSEEESADATGGFEFDDEPEETPPEDVETAGNPSSDPLADNFDDE